jgi:hypothetical protein
MSRGTGARSGARLAIAGGIVCVVCVACVAEPMLGDLSIAAGHPLRHRGANCHGAPARLRCPDLIMSAPSGLRLDRRTRPGRVLLRAASAINNRGRGPLELRARRLGRRRWRVYQAIYDRHGEAHLFRTAAKLVFKFVPGDRYRYGDVGSASYWKLKHAASFQLWSLARRFKAVALVRSGPKVAYCLRDLSRTAPSRASPIAPVYPACSQQAGIGSDVLGTSVGWSDVYPYEYPEQWIDVTGLRGRFAFVQRADPDRLFVESNHRNDVSETFVLLPSGRVLGHRVGVSLPRAMPRADASTPAGSTQPRAQSPSRRSRIGTATATARSRSATW